MGNKDTITRSGSFYEPIEKKQMTYSRRKPYQRQSYGIREFYRAPARHLKDSIGPESVFEKPYLTSEYGDMQQSPNVGSVPGEPSAGDGLVCQYNSNNCHIYASCYAASGIKIDGGPEEVDAGYEAPNIIKGALIDWSIGEDSRVINLIFDPNVNQNIVQIGFIDGWGERHTETLNSLCSVAGCSFNPDDNFSGTNGTNPDSDRWTVHKNDQSYGALKDGELYYGPTAGDDENYTSEYIGNFIFVKNFDIRIAFDVTTLTQPGDNRSRIGIQIVPSTPSFDTAYASIMRSYSSAGTDGYVSDFDGAAESEYVKSDASGKLRIKRSGSNFTVWEWHTGNAQWEWNGSTAGRTIAVNDSGCRVKLVFEQENNGNVEVAFDDFEIYQVDELICTDTCEYTIDDFFTGVNNSQPDTDRWQNYDYQSYVRIWNNRFRFGPVPDDDWDDALATWVTKFELVGDFDVQIDFVVTNTPRGGEDGNYIGLSLSSNFPTSYQMIIGIGGDKYVAPRYYHWSWYNAWQAISTSDTTGKFRFVRVGNALTAYYWDASASQWEWNGSAAGRTHPTYGSSNQRVILRLDSNPNWIGDVSFDNFKVNSADGIVCL